MTYDTTNRTGTGMAGTTSTLDRQSAWRLLRAADIEGRTVKGLNDEVIGSVGDLYVDYEEHAVRYATVDVGGFLGMGAKTVLIPFERLQWSGDDLFLPVEKKVLEDAPEFDPMADYDAAYEDRIGSIWGVESYWAAPTYGRSHSHWRER